MWRQGQCRVFSYVQLTLSMLHPILTGLLGCPALRAVPGTALARLLVAWVLVQLLHAFRSRLIKYSRPLDVAMPDCCALLRSPCHFVKLGHSSVVVVTAANAFRGVQGQRGPHFCPLPLGCPRKGCSSLF